MTRVIDGDTFVAELVSDIGFNGTVTFTQRFRLNGINAPSVKSVPGQQAAAFATQLLMGGPVALRSLKPYKYGDEWMADVVTKDSRNVSDEMVKGGWAVPWDGRGLRPKDEG